MTAYILTTSDEQLITYLTHDLTITFGGQPVAERTETGARITGLDLLRTLTPYQDGSITDDTDGIHLWAEGDSHLLVPETH
jgi:hypothetical protein